MWASSRPRIRPVYGVLLVLFALSSACGATAPAEETPKSVPALELAVLAAVGGRLDYCDPDQFPVSQGDPLANATERLPAIQADTAAFGAILEHEGLSSGRQFSSDELIAISEDYKQMQEIELRPAGDGFRFSVLVPNDMSATGNERVEGTVTRSGSVTIGGRGPGVTLNCPICLAADVRIATPTGDVSVRDIRPGMRVWTTDRQGGRVIGVVLEAGQVQAPPGHQMVRLFLADGRTVSASPGHPTPDGRRVGDLRPGDRLGGSTVARLELLPYAGRTYDLLPSGPTGTYVANGVLLASTLAN